MKIKIAIVGIGNIGKRHLQALDNVKPRLPIVCYDNNAAAQASVKVFCAANSIETKEISFSHDLVTLLAEIDRRTIVIVASTATSRVGLIQKVLRRRPLAVIAEKPVCQNENDYRALIRAARRARVPVYVNFTRHMYDFYRTAKKEIKTTENMAFTAMFSGGMACIGIHMMELATWLMAAKKFKILYAHNRFVYETKRRGFYDCAGEMLVRFDRSKLAFFKAEKLSGAFSIKLAGHQREYNWYEYSNKMTAIDVTGEFSSDYIATDITIPYISQLTDKVVVDLRRNQRTKILPTLEQAFLAHKLLFTYLNMNKIAGTNIT
jgi:predicted dehydrogenase